MSFETSILLLVFNRPDTTEKVFLKIREIQPSRLFIAADGPRHHKAGEKEKCEAARKLVLEGIDWPCEVKTLFREENLGCGKAVSGAISWFFDHVEEGIILEDDCVPDLSFFRFCEAMLEKYRHDERISIISGNNFQQGNWRGDGSYFFSGRCHIWGWATWKRTWKHFDLELTGWNTRTLKEVVRSYYTGKKELAFWKLMYRQVKNRKVDSWALPFTFSVWRSGGINIIPNVNLVSNIGFGDEATHTGDKRDKFARIPAASLTGIIHPSVISVNEDADRFFFENYIPAPRPLWLRIAKSIYRNLRKIKQRFSGRILKPGI